MSVIDKYSEISGAELVNKLKKYVETVGIGYCIYSHRYQEIIIFLVVGMIMMAGMFAVTVVEDICDTITEKISDL